jgi:hypothetical protein
MMDLSPWPGLIKGQARGMQGEWHGWSEVAPPRRQVDRKGQPYYTRCDAAHHLQIEEV